MNKKYILFDLDGTLVDSGDGIKKSVKHSLNKVGIKENREDILNSFIGPPLIDSYMKNYDMSWEEADKLVSLYREYYKDNGVLENTLYPDIDRILKKLVEAGNVLILATSKPEIFAKKVLKQHRIDEYFSFVGGATLDHSISTKVEVLEHIFSNFNIKKDNAYMIGDTKYDILGGKEFQLKTIGVSYGYGSIEELKNAEADFIVNNPVELIKILIK